MADTFKINGADYECEFTLTNNDAAKKINFSKSAIKNLNLEENLFYPFTHATVNISNPLDYIEDNFSMRGDGNDIFEFSLRNVDSSKSAKLNYKFVVNNERNITDRYDRLKNTKVYELLDFNYYKLNVTIPYGVRYSGKVGDIIKRILKSAIGDDVIDEDNWEDGDHIISNFPEYIIPTIGYKYSDLLLYLLRIYYYKSDDIHVRGFLRFDRSTGKYSLLPITKIYEKNKDLLAEAMGVGDLVFNTDSNKNNPPPDAPVNKYLHHLKNTSITTPGLSFSNEYFMNGLVSGYDNILGEHIMREIRVEDLKKSWKSKFVDTFSSIGGKPKPFLVLNKNKKEQQFRIFSFPYSVSDSVKIVEAEMTSNFCFYNLQLTLNNVGDTNRRPGKFLDIYRPAKHEGEFDRKLLGRWLITKVSHEFVNDSYFNTIWGSKTYIGPGVEPTDDI